MVVKGTRCTSTPSIRDAVRVYCSIASVSDPSRTSSVVGPPASGGAGGSETAGAQAASGVRAANATTVARRARRRTSSMGSPGEGATDLHVW